MISRFAGEDVVNAIETEVTVTVADAVMTDSLVAAALSVTEPVVDGAVQTVVAPLAVCAGLNEPHGDGEQVQSTPSFKVSPVTVAAIEAP